MMRSRLPMGVAALAFVLTSVASIDGLVLAQTNMAAPQPSTIRVERVNAERQSTGRRVALVIGNANYSEAGRLINPVNDAQGMATVLGELGFEVILRTNSNLRQMEEALDQFYAAIRQGSVGVFYYAGHGIQSEGENYLIPIDAQMQVEQDLRYEAMPLGQVLTRMEAAGNSVNIVILDACRNNPFARRWRSGQGGLAAIDAARGVLIAYATAPGGVAADGDGQNGTFTAALLRHIRTPNQDVEQLFRRVRADVSSETREKQIPWTSSSLIGDFTFYAEQSAASEYYPVSPIGLPESPTFQPRSPVTLPCAGSVCEGLPQ